MYLVFEVYLSIQTPCIAYGQYMLDMEEIGGKKFNLFIVGFVLVPDSSLLMSLIFPSELNQSLNTVPQVNR